jgi:hypothetical protein
MEIEAGKLYRTKSGDKAKVYEVYADSSAGMWNIHGAVQINNVWEIARWCMGGIDLAYSQSDLIALWWDDSQVSIPWDKISDPLKFVAMDKDGTWCAYGDKPSRNYISARWHVPSSRTRHYALPPEFCPKGYTGHWKDSLFERPHEEVES